ncbi:MAG: MFS transporter [Acidobacteriaceae bacterium]|nr:MFS transporter [Acidobacteriaceae bacterium]
MSDTRSSRNPLANLPRPVWLLGWVSLATDAASEAIYPLLPFFLTTVLGASPVSLGIVEGAAEAVNSVLKLWSGRMADRARRKRPLVLAGYTISSLVRPFIALAHSWTHVLAVRVTDRVGKGIRSAPRDAILATWASADTRGRVYGVHRAMDHTGAVIGPILAVLFLLWYPGQYRTLFALTMIPGAIAVALIFFVREKDADQPVDHPRAHEDVTSDGDAKERLPRRLQAFFLVLTLFTLGNSTDAFLLLKLTDAAGAVTYVPLIWAALHVVKASSSVVGGAWSDRIGRRAVIALGWTVYAAVYFAFAATDRLLPLIVIFLCYGVYFGLTEGVEKALVADLAPVSRRGHAFGVYNAVIGIGALAASVVFGLVWNAFGSATAFTMGGVLALVASGLLFAAVPR